MAHDGRDLPTGGHAAGASRILVVEPDALIARLLQRVLEPSEVVCCRLPSEALACFDGGASFDAVFADAVDLRDGVAVYAELFRRHPRVARGVIFMTGAPDSAQVLAFLRKHPGPRLEKPFGLDDVHEALRQALRDSRPIGERRET